MHEHKNLVDTIPILQVRWEEGKGGGVPAWFGLAPRLLRTNCLPCEDQLKEDCWTPSPPIQKTQGPEAQTTLGSSSEPRASPTWRLAPLQTHSKNPHQCYFIIINVRYKQMVQKSQRAPVPLQEAPVNKQENKVRKQKGSSGLSLAHLGS